MDTRDREAIEGLFTRIEDVERQAGPREAEAERLIAERVQRQPAAPYYLAQTVVMQDYALKSLQARVDELEKAAKAQPEASEGGGFFSRASGGPAGVSPSRAASVPGVGSGPRGPWGSSPPEPQPGAHSPTPASAVSQPQPYAQPSYASPQGFGGRMGGGGGGFLAGAAQTAMGVAGGVMLGNALGSMLGGQGGLFGSHEGLGGGGTEVTENVTKIDEAPQEDIREAADANPATDPSPDDAGYQDAAYDEPAPDDGFSGDDGGFDDI